MPDSGASGKSTTHAADSLSPHAVARSGSVTQSPNSPGPHSAQPLPPVQKHATQLEPGIGQSDASRHSSASVHSSPPLLDASVVGSVIIVASVVSDVVGVAVVEDVDGFVSSPSLSVSTSPGASSPHASPKHTTGRR